MQSLKELYRIGKGPSSSHTIGPETACKRFLSDNPTADEFDVILYESLAKTGVGHGTDSVIKSVLQPVHIHFDESTKVPHPNTMDLIAKRQGKEISRARVYSVGGGAIEIEGQNKQNEGSRYAMKYRGEKC